MAVDVEDSAKLLDLVNGNFAVLNAAPFRLTTPIAEAAPPSLSYVSLCKCWFEVDGLLQPLPARSCYMQVPYIAFMK